MNLLPKDERFFEFFEQQSDVLCKAAHLLATGLKNGYQSMCDASKRIEALDQDKRVPPPNAFELYRALQDLGVPSKLILYKGFGHPIDKPKQQRAVMEHNYEWFSKYIWGEERQPELSAP